MPIHNLIKLRHSIRWNLFITLGLIMLICQIITVLWLWYESKEQIAALVDLSLTAGQKQEIVRHEEFESIVLLFMSTFTMMGMTLLLSYRAIKWITHPLEKLAQELTNRTADNLLPVTSTSKIDEVQSITTALNVLFLKLSDTLQQERLFTADVAHELRTPLAGIRLHLELIEKEHGIDCQALVERLDRLVHTITQLLTLARASQKFIVGQYHTVDVHRDIYQVLQSEFTELTAQKQQILVWQLTSPLCLQGDCTLLCLMLRNLVENACRYSPADTTIVLSGVQQADHIVFSVRDEGSGIDENRSGQLTQAFVRMDRRQQGVGLGLSIVQRIVKLHQGELVLQNRQDRSGTEALCKLSLVQQAKS